MILDRNKYELMLTKEMLKQKPKLCIVDYVVEDEIHIIDALFKFTGNFLILLETPSNIKNDHIRMSCNKNNICVFLNNLFNNTLKDNYNLKVERCNKTQRSMIFIKEKQDDPKTFYDFFKKSYYFSYLNQIFKGYHLSDIWFYKMKCVVTLSNQQQISEKIQSFSIYDQENKQKLILELFGGIGDYFMLFSIIYEYLDRMTRKGIEVLLPIINNDQKANYLFNCFFSKQEKLFFDNEKMYTDCLSINKLLGVISLYDLYWDQIRKNKCKVKLQHFTEVIKEILGIEKAFDPYYHRDIMIKKINDNLSIEEKNLIDSFLCKKDYVGFQFFTGIIDEKNDIWATEKCRNWNEENTQAFISLCKSNNINLLTFNNHPYNLQELESLCGLSICGYAYAISKLKLVVGIDSSAGHIASLFGVPSITIWGKQTPVDFFGSKVSFQAIRLNHSIYTETGNINLIKPEFVFQNMKYLLEKIQEGSYDFLKENSCSIAY